MKRHSLSYAVPVAIVAAGAALSIPRSQAAPPVPAANSPVGARQDPALNDLVMGPAPLRRVAARAPEELPELVVRLASGRSIDRIARESGARVVRKSRIKGAWILAPQRRSLKDTLAFVRTRPGVTEAFINRRLPTEEYDFVPDDPFFAPNVPPGGPNGGWPGQFYLSRPGVPGGDVNILPAWSDDVTGLGVRIGIVDDGFDFSHPDLAPNYDATRSIDVASGSLDPSPRLADDSHGTFVAGSAVARGGNGIGITGAAPFATWSGIRVPLGSGEMSTEINVAAIEHRSTGADRSLSLKNHSYGFPNPFVDEDENLDALSRTANEGTIHVFAAGNARGAPGQDCGKIGAQSSPDVITVAALNGDGTPTWYSCFGSSVFVTSYGGDNRQGLLHLSTDRTGLSLGYSNTERSFFPDGEGNYALQMGTSFTAPTVTGILALVKQVRPGLNVRWAKHLLARTSRKVDPQDSSPVGGWTTNGAGFSFNPNYGFGLIDASALVDLARNTSGVSAPELHQSPVVETPKTIPDNGQITLPITISKTKPLEEVQVRLAIRHGRRGQLEGYLQSPSGTVSRLFIRSNGDLGTNINWVFTSNAFWGENPNGTWKLTLRDTQRGVRGTLLGYGLGMRMGTLLGVNP